MHVHGTLAHLCELYKASRVNGATVMEINEKTKKKKKQPKMWLPN